MRTLLLPALASCAIALDACGGDDNSSSTTKPSAQQTAKAATEAEATRTAIEAALKNYDAGDTATAGDQVAEAYVSHFEDVEQALEAKDAELKESLEKRIYG